MKSIFEGKGILNVYIDDDFERWMALADLYIYLMGKSNHITGVTCLSNKLFDDDDGNRRHPGIMNFEGKIKKLEGELSLDVKNGDKVNAITIFGEIEQDCHASESLSESDKYEGFSGLVRIFDLTSLEAKVLAILVNLEIRYTFGYSTVDLNYFEMLHFLSGSFSDVFNNIRVFSPEGGLIKNNLIEPKGISRRRQIFRTRRFSFQPTLNTMRYILGLFGEDIYLNNEGDDDVEDEMLEGRTGGRNADAILNEFKSRVSLEDVILPVDTKEAVMEALAIVEQRDLLFNEWHIDRLIEKGRGTVLLFYGPPGTGKTMTAEAVANHLGMDVCFVNYARLENPFVGMTERNIDVIFKVAREKNLFLLFDECDSFLSARGEGFSTGRYYNKVVNLLLKEIENFEGVLVMTTNRVGTLDEALDRRVALKVKFGMPEYEGRLAIWKRFLSIEGAVSDDIDIEYLAREHHFSGGEIKNAFYSAARSAACRINEGVGKRIITMDDLIKGCQLVLEGAGEDKEERMGF
jgi:AAA+ superfamily predicted ATPase